MTKREAMRRVCASAAALLDNDGENLWLQQGPDGSELSERDQKRMRDAFDRLVAELHRRGS